VPAALLAAALGLAPAAPAASPKHNATIREQTGNGYRLTVSVGKSGKTGRLKLTCPDGKSLGETGRFDINKNGAAMTPPTRSRRAPRASRAC
jgi:hypothetical protein